MYNRLDQTSEIMGPVNPNVCSMLLFLVKFTNKFNMVHNAYTMLHYRYICLLSIVYCLLCVGKYNYDYC